MPALPKLRVAALERLAAQLRYEPPAAARRQLPAAERLATELDPSQTYPEDFVVFRITGFRPEIENPEMIVGEALLSDLSAFVERLCASGQIELEEILEGDAPPAPEHEDGRPSTTWLTVGELCDKWDVSRKTIERYRRQGLIARRARQDAGRQRLLFAESAVERFEARRADKVAAAGRFSRLDDDLERRILKRAKRYRTRLRCSLNGAAERIAMRYGRSHEAVRTVLQRHDATARRPIFPGRGPLSDHERKIAARAMDRGVDASQIAARLGRSKASIYRVWNERRAERLHEIGLGPDPDQQDTPEIDERILTKPRVTTALNTPTPRSLAVVLALPKTTSRAELTAQRQQAEAAHALMLRARAGIESLARFNPAPHDLDRIETDLRWIGLLWRELVIAELPAMLRTVGARLEREPTSVPPRALASLLERAIDGVIEGVRSHDPARGGTLAARIGVEVDRATLAWSRAEGERFTSRESRGLAAVRTDPAQVPMPEWEQRLTPWARYLRDDRRARAHLDSLEEPQRTIIESRMGWGGQRPRTTEELGDDLNMPVAHITRIERDAMRTLRRIARQTDDARDESAAS